MLRWILIAVLIVCLICSTGLLARSCYYGSRGRLFMRTTPSGYACIYLSDGALSYLMMPSTSKIRKTVPWHEVRFSNAHRLSFGSAGWQWWPTYSRVRQGPTFVLIPLYLPMLLFGAWAAYFLHPVHRRRKRRKLGLCVKCGYDVRGSAERCPECGERI